MKKTVAVFLFFLFILPQAFASSGANDHAFIRKGDRAFRKAQLGKALTYYLKALEIDPKDCYANFQAGAIYYLTDSARLKSLPYFENTIKYARRIADDTIIDAYYYLGNCYMLAKAYGRAIPSFNKYLVHLVDDKLDADMLKEVKQDVEICKVAPTLLKRSADSTSYLLSGKYQPTYIKNLGSMINTPYPEYAEVLLNKDSTIVFTSRRPTTKRTKQDYPTGSYYEDIFISTKDTKGQWTPPSLFSNQLHIKRSRLNFASVCISSDDKTLFIFNKGLVYTCRKNGNTWSKPEKIGKNIKNIKKYVPSVFLSYDGKELLLVSDKKGGYGGKDIYISTIDDKGIWSVPQNLGPEVNSAFDEDAPFLLPDNKTLFFSSKGHSGLGGYDIYKTVYENGKWSTPVNLGTPINSSGDDIFFTYDTTLKSGYFSSSRVNGYGDMDLYSMSFVCDNIDSTALQGTIASGPQQNIPSANIQFTDIASQKTSSTISDDKGNYSIYLKPDAKYTMNINAPGYITSRAYLTTPHQCDPYNLYQVVTLHYVNTDSLHTGQAISIKNAFLHTQKNGYMNAKDDPSVSAFIATFKEESDVWMKDSNCAINYTQAQIDSLNPHKVQVAIVSNNQTKSPALSKQPDTTKSVATKNIAVTAKPGLTKVPNILFDINGSQITSKYYASLDSLAQALRSNTKIKVQINGYADNTGEENRNLILSGLRAAAVEEYLFNKSVKPASIRTKAKGTVDPVAPNDGVHNYLNRRVEVIIIQ